MSGVEHARMSLVLWSVLWILSCMGFLWGLILHSATFYLFFITTPICMGYMCWHLVTVIIDTESRD